MPPAGVQVVRIVTNAWLPRSWTRNVVTMSRPTTSSRTTPEAGSVTTVWPWTLRPPSVVVKLVTVPAPTPPASTRKSENAVGQDAAVVPVEVADDLEDETGGGVDGGVGFGDQHGHRTGAPGSSGVSWCLDPRSVPRRPGHRSPSMPRSDK